jgi:transglutaminase-like putative cysteine protease
MREFVRAYKADPVIYDLARQIVAGVREKDYVGEARAIHEWVRDNVRYVQDPREVEAVQTPPMTLNIGQGDCDDKATLAAALLESVNHPTRFKAVGPDSDLTHVYVETYVVSRKGKTWIASDTTEQVPFGWRAPNMRAQPMIVNN